MKGTYGLGDISKPFFFIFSSRWLDKGVKFSYNVIEILKWIRIFFFYSNNVCVLNGPVERIFMCLSVRDQSLFFESLVMFVYNLTFVSSFFHGLYKFSKEVS